jgi:hypothetical protein
MTRTIDRRLGWMLMLGCLAVAGASFALERGGPSRALWRMHEEFVMSVLHKPVEGTPWFVSNLELIGIAKHDPPRVFGGGLSMDVFHRPNEAVPLERGNGRALDSWEEQVLRDLDAGQRLVVEKEDPYGHVRVAGAIRAGDECLGCHQDKRAGDMLGAFVYRLSPIKQEVRKP